MAVLLRGVALITGAASGNGVHSMSSIRSWNSSAAGLKQTGIGQATSICFSNHGLRRLALLDIDSDGLAATTNFIKKQAEDAEVLTVLADMSNEGSVVGAIQKVIDHFGRIDIAVNNAGISGSLKPSTEVSSSEFRTVLEVNTIGLWIVQREEIRYMMRQEPLEHSKGSRGVIVNMSSAFGLVAPSRRTPAAAYTTSKHGILAITKNDANSFAKDGIRINAICPGFVNTPAMFASVGESDVMKEEMEKIPMGRFAQPEEIAQAIAFLASPMSSYMSGSSLVVDGGYTAQ